MRISIFLSCPQPFTKEQQKFVDAITGLLKQHGFEPRTLGVTDYDMNLPLNGCRRLMMESNGILTLALRRIYIEKGQSKPGSIAAEESVKPAEEQDVSGRWLTSPWCHIEAAMAYQIGLPILVLRESGVLEDGILEKGNTGVYLPEFNLDDGGDVDQKIHEYLCSDEFVQIIGIWEGRVRRVVEAKGYPKVLY